MAKLPLPALVFPCLSVSCLVCLVCNDEQVAFFRFPVPKYITPSVPVPVQGILIIMGTCASMICCGTSAHHEFSSHPDLQHFNSSPSHFSCCHSYHVQRLVEPHPDSSESEGSAAYENLPLACCGCHRSELALLWLTRHLDSCR